MKRILALILAASMLLFLLAACKKSETVTEPSPEAPAPSAEEPAPEAEPDSNAPEEGEPADPSPEEEPPEPDDTLAEIEFWMINWNTLDTGADTTISRIEAAVNEITEAKINTHVNFTWVPIGTYGSQLQMAIANGETVDYAIAINEMAIPNAISIGACYDITELLPQYAPELVETVGEKALSTYKSEGRNYGVPNFWAYSSSLYLDMRSDVLEELGMMEFAQSMTTWEEYEELMAKVVAEAGMYGIGGGSANGLLDMRNAFLLPSGLYDGVVFDDLGDQLNMIYESDGQVSCSYDQPMAYDMCQMFADWYNVGYVYPDTGMGDNIGVQTLVDENLFFSAFNKSSFGHEESLVNAYASPMITIKVAQGMIVNSNLTSLGAFVPVTSQEPEAAVKFMNLIYTDPAIMNLLDYGIEGESYVLNDKGEACFPEGGNMGNTYHVLFENLFGNFFLLRPWDGNGADYRDRAYEDYLSSSTSNYLGMSVDMTGHDTLIAALTSVKNEYEVRLRSGLYTDALYEEFLTKLDAAGIDDYVAFFQNAVDNFQK